jgi:hypothetical protein
VSPFVEPTSDFAIEGRQVRQPAPARERDDHRLTAELRDPVVVAVIALTVFAFFLRSSQIHQSLYGDEAWTYTDILGKSLRAVVINVHTGGENSPPLFFLLAYGTGKLGDLSVWIRLPSLVLGALTIPLLYLIGRETVGRIAGLLAGAIMALSPFSFFYGVEARPYATMAFFIALSTWALLRAVRTGLAGWWMLYTLAAVAAAYSHYTSVFVLVAQGVWSLWVCRDRLRSPVIAGAAALVAYAPWIPHLRGKDLAVIGLLHPLTTHNVITDLMRPIVGYPYGPLSAIPTDVGLGLVIACALVGLAFVLRDAGASTAGGDQRWPDRFWLLVALALITPVGMLLYSELSTDLWLSRGLYGSVPAASMVLATLLLAIPRPLGVGAVVIVLGVLAYGTVQAARPEWRRPPTREIARYLDGHAVGTDRVAFVSFLGEPTVMEQVRKRHQVIAYESLAESTPPGASTYVVVEDRFAQARHIRDVPAAPAGLRLTGQRHYASQLMPFDVAVYRRPG